MRILHLYISPEHSFFGHHGRPAGASPMIEQDSIQLVAGKGITGDRFFGYREDYKGQVTFFAIETYRRLCDTFAVHDRDPSVFRRNIITEGEDLNRLIGREFRVGGIRFLGTEEAKPCYWMNQAFCEGAEEALRGSGGLRARILDDGILRTERAAAPSTANSSAS